jgi:hypothetical protein
MGGRATAPLFYLPITGGCRFGRDLCLPFPHCLIGSMPISLSLSSNAHIAPLEVCLASLPEASVGRLAPYDSPPPHPRPCARL